MSNHPVSHTAEQVAPNVEPLTDDERTLLSDLAASDRSSWSEAGAILRALDVDADFPRLATENDELRADRSARGEEVERLRARVKQLEIDLKEANDLYEANHG